MTVTAPPRPSPTAPVAGRRRIPQRWTALLVLCLSLLLIMLDNTVLNVALPTLVRDLDATSTELQWIVDAYALLFAGFMLVAGSLADRYGRKRTYMVGMGIFGAGSVAAAFSGSVSALVVSRAAMGLGAAFIMPSTLSLITDMFPDPAERQRAIGAWAGMSGLGVALGPIVAGVLLEHFAWGSVFLVNVPVVVAAVALAIPLVPDSRNPEARRLDLVGAAVSTAGLGLVLWALIEAPTRGWSSAGVLLVGCTGLVVLAGFVAWERRCREPMLSLDFFRHRSFSVATAMAGVTMFALFGALFMLTQFLQFGLGFTPLEAGVRVLPAAGMLAVSAPLSSVMVRRLGTRLTVVTGVLVIAGGLWQISHASASSTYADVVAGMVMLGVGAGLVVPSATASVMSTLPRGRTGVGAATNGVSIQVGGALGVAVIGSLLVTRYQDRVAEALAPFAVPSGAMETIRGSIGGALAVASQVGGAVGDALARVAREAFVSGMDLGLVVGACVALGGAVLALVALPDRVGSGGGVQSDDASRPDGAATHSVSRHRR